MIVLLDIREPQERTIPWRQLGELAAYRVVRRRGVGLRRHVAQPIEPRHLSFCTSPPVGHEIPRNPEHVAAQILVAESSDVCTKQAAERILHDVVGIAGVTRHAIDVRPERTRRALVEPRKLNFIQRVTPGPSERPRLKWTWVTVR